MKVTQHPKPGPKKKSKPKEIVRDQKYLDYIAKQPCIICRNIETVAHHQSISGKGTGIKCSDYETIPLCWIHHNEIHSTGKLTFAKKYGIDYAYEISRLREKYKKLKK